MLVDSHAHLDDARFDQDRSIMIQRAWDAGIRQILTIGNGSGPDSMGCGIPIAESYSWIQTTVGVHPHDAARVEPRHLEMMRELAAHPKVVAIGEAGLDYHYDKSPRDVQRDVFRQQLELACILDLPIIVHTRDADDDTKELLRRNTPRRGVIHCFTAGPDLADFALELGFMISFSGIITFPKAGDLTAIARRVPSDRILIETDCPYLAPVPHRGKRNEPAFVADTAQFVARLRNEDPDELASAASSNFSQLFQGREGN